MSIDLDKVGVYLAQATEEKNEIKSKYNEVLDLVDSSAKIEDLGKQGASDDRDIDGEVSDAIKSLVSYLMTSLFNRTGEWATASIDEVKYNAQYGEDAVGTMAEINKTLSKDITQVFSQIQSSNYYVEIVKTIKDLVQVGTGGYAIRETGLASKPFTYEYLSLDNLFILSSSANLPLKVFKKHPEITAVYLKDVFGMDVKVPDGISDEDYETTFDVYEVSIPEYDEEEGITKFTYAVLNEDLSEVLFEKELKYNPMVVARWDVSDRKAWGTSIVSDNISIVKSINEFKALYKLQARKIANPPKGFFGTIQQYNAINTNEGAINYFGNTITDGGGGFQGMQDIYSNSNLMPLYQSLQDERALFRKALMAEDIGMKAFDNKYTTATAIQISHELFRQRFGNTYELINSEVLKPAFLGPFAIMLKYQLLSTKEIQLPLLGIKYTNELSKASDKTNAQNLVIATDIMLNMMDKNQKGLPMNISKILPDILKKYEINPEFFPTESELEQIAEQRKQAQQAQQQAMMQAQQAQGGQNGQEV